MRKVIAPRLPPCLIASAKARRTSSKAFDRGDRSRHGVRRKHRRHRSSASSTTSSPAANLRATAGSPISTTQMDLPRCCASHPRSIQRRRRPRSRSRSATGDDDGADSTCSLSQRATHRQRRSCYPRKTTRPPARRYLKNLLQRVALAKSSSSPIKSTRLIGRLKERYPRVVRYYKLCHDPEDRQPSIAQFDADKHRKARNSSTDAICCSKTDRKNLSADELWRIYTLLSPCAENAFRDMKTPLAIRPRSSTTSNPAPTPIFFFASWLTTCSSPSKKPCSTKASTPPGRACATPSKPTRSAPSSCPPTTALRYASERPQLPTQTSSKSIETSASPNTSSPQNTHGHSPPIVTNGRTIPLKQHNFILKKLEVGLSCSPTCSVWLRSVLGLLPTSIGGRCISNSAAIR